MLNEFGMNLNVTIVFKRVVYKRVIAIIAGLALSGPRPILLLKSVKVLYEEEEQKVLRKIR